MMSDKETKEYVEDITQGFRMRESDGISVGKTEESYKKDLSKFLNSTTSNY